MYKFAFVAKSMRIIYQLFKSHVGGLCTLTYFCLHNIESGDTSIFFIKMHIHSRHVLACVMISLIGRVAKLIHVGLTNTCIAQITCLLPIASRILHVGFV